MAEEYGAAVPWLEKALTMVLLDRSITNAEAEWDALWVAARQFNLAIAHLRSGNEERGCELLEAVVAWDDGSEEGKRLREMAIGVLDELDD